MNKFIILKQDILSWESVCKIIYKIKLKKSGFFLIFNDDYFFFGYKNSFYIHYKS